MTNNNTLEESEDEELFGSFEGKLWSKAIEKAVTAPFPEVALMHVLKRVYERGIQQAKEEERTLIKKEMIEYGFNEEDVNHFIKGLSNTK